MTLFMDMPSPTRLHARFTRNAFCLLLLCLFARPAAAEQIDYTLTIEGVGNSALKSQLREKSLLLRLADNRPENRLALQRRIENDVQKFKKILKEHGYYGASLNHTIRDDEQTHSVVFQINKGKRYRIKDFMLQWGDNKAQPDNVTVPSMPIGEPALPETILTSTAELVNAIKEKGYPLAEIEGRRLYLHHDTQRVSVELLLDSGPEAVFGASEIKGLKRLNKSFVKRRLAWKKGQKFNIKKIVATQKQLTRTGVISQVDITYGQVSESGALPVTITVKESKHRTIGAGINYSTTLGVTGNVFWEHRNLAGEAQKFRIKAKGGESTRALEANHTKPDLWANKKLVWQNTADFRQEFLEAFDRDTAALRTALNYKYSATSSLSGGLALERNRVTEKKQDEENFTLLALPMRYRYDMTNDLLNPRDGMRLNIGLTPHYIMNDQAGFITNEADISHYTPIGRHFVLANRARAALIFGQSQTGIPADKRLYSGGGGSVRAFDHQRLGPLDDDNNPKGGKTALELGTEARYKVTDRIEGVAFVEGGRVTEAIELQAESDFLWGGGFGARYHSAVGPVRFDVAVPFNKRKPDDEYQLYLSIGQAF